MKTILNLFQFRSRKARLRWFLCVSLGIVSGSAFGQSTWNGGAGDGNWNSPLNWDTASVPGIANQAIFNGGQTVTMDTDARIATLTLNGMPFTLNAGPGASSLQSNRIEVNTGASGSAVNSAFILNQSGVTPPNAGTTSIVFADNNAVLTFNGPITTSGANVLQIIRNETAAGVTGTKVVFNGPIALRASGNTSANSVVQFQAGNTTNTSGIFEYNVGISNGASSAGVTFSGGTHIHNVAHTYTGNTALGANSPNVSGFNVINSDVAFSTGEIQFTGAAGQTNFIRSADTSTRTLANRIRLQRNAGFDGTGSISLTGVVYQTNTSNIVNNITGAGKQLRLEAGNNLYLRGVSDASPRVLSFNGSGTTVLNRAVYESPLSDLVTPNPMDGTQGANLVRGQAGGPYGTLQYNGTGRLILGANFVANYGGATSVASGTLQIGEGGAPVSVGAFSGMATPSTLLGTGTGTIELNHNSSGFVLPNRIASVGGSLNIRNTGTGKTILNDVQFGTGDIVAANGTVQINGGRTAAISATGVNPSGSGVFGTGSQAANVNLVRMSGNELIVTDAFAANFYRGQVVTLTEGTTSVTTMVVDTYEVSQTANALAMGSYSDSTHHVIRFASNLPTLPAVSTAGGANSMDSLSITATTGTGARNVIAAGGRIEGNGVIGGNLSSAANLSSVIAPGASIGTLEVDGNAVLGGVLEIEFNTAAGQKIDLLDVNGSFTLGASSVLNIINLGTGSLTDSAYVFASHNGTINGTFGTINGLQSGYLVDYNYLGNSIALIQAVPEPSSLMLIGLCVGGVFLRRRRS